MNKLKFLREQYGHLPKQGTAAWLASRRTKIGGSEVASVASKSKFCTREQLVKQKLEGTRIRSAPCTFGRVFEVVAKEFLAADMEIHELGAIPCSRFPVCYSPDGVVVQGDSLTLVEIKCPWRRKRIADVPPQYNYQIQTGMAVLPCEQCMFLQFLFRLCTIKQLGPGSEYNRWLHFDSRRILPPKKPMRYGFIHFQADTSLIDLGALPPDDADKLCIVEGLPMRVYWEQLDLPLSGYIMPFKLFEYTKVLVDRELGFLDTLADKLWTTHAELVAGRD